ncbi:MAG: hypothetical protein WHV66_09640 [Anaerolineales bacterium]
MSKITLDSRTLQKACHEVYQRFPVMKGVLPHVQSYARNRFLLIFENRAITSNGRMLTQVIRAVIDAEGTIKKITTSR